MDRILFIVDEISTWVGKTFGWCILILTFTTSYEVFARYVFGAPTEWAFDAGYMLYGTLFMMAGAYTLSRNGHVRGDFIYAGYGFAKFSWMMNEHSSASPNGPPVYHFKALIPITGVLMVMQGTVEVIRCAVCIRTGVWPQRLHDVEELERRILEEAEQGKFDVVKDLEEIGQRKGTV
jgi:TRAP-type mannitol/chloroaromatic compound transport system permease small subunit